MAITSTGALFKALTFDNISSRDYGVYITGQAVYNAPQRDVEMITIPARNGAFALDNGRFENIEVSYPAGIFASNETDFAQAISDFRNYMCSREGYCRLEDEYNPDEYRMAIYKSGLEVTPAQLKAGEFEIVFECKPQRWLKSGEEKKTIGEWHDVVSASGSILQIDNNANLEYKNAVLTVNLIQEGSGTPSPSNPRPFVGVRYIQITKNTTKNLLPTARCTDRTDAGITTTRMPDYSIHLSGIAEADSRWWLAEDNLDYLLKAGTYTLSPSNVELLTTEGYKSGTFTTGNDLIINNVRFNLTIGEEYDVTTYPQLELGTQATDFVKFNMASGGGVDFSTVMYGGTVNLFTKEKVETMGHIASYAGEEIGEPWWSSIDEYVSGTTPSTGAEVVYTLAEPAYSTFSVGTIPTLSAGTNIVFANFLNGILSVEYGDDANSMYNPTLFKSSPLLEVKGHGTININELTSWAYSIELVDEVLGEVTIAEEQQVSAAGKSIALPSKFNVGDVITIAPSKLYWRVQPSSSSVTTLAGGTPTDSHDGTTTTSFGSLEYYTNTPEIQFTYTNNATETWTNVTTLPVTYRLNGSSRSGTVTVTTKFTLQPVGNTNRLNWTRSSGKPTGLNVTFTYSPSTLGAITGNSTVSALGNPTYIDLDIGEAYKIQTNPLTYISLDKYLDLGSELPTFKTGRNKITMSDTITELVITPRWWKV